MPCSKYMYLAPSGKRHCPLFGVTSYSCGPKIDEAVFSGIFYSFVILLVRFDRGTSVAEPTGQTTEPTVLASVWRYRWLVLLLAVAFASLGWLYASQTAQWSATATLAVQDPRSSNLFDQARQRSHRRLRWALALSTKDCPCLDRHRAIS